MQESFGEAGRPGGARYPLPVPHGPVWGLVSVLLVILAGTMALQTKTVVQAAGQGELGQPSRATEAQQQAQHACA